MKNISKTPVVSHRKLNRRGPAGMMKLAVGGGILNKLAGKHVSDMSVAGV